jgi:hypothetical protein
LSKDKAPLSGDSYNYSLIEQLANLQDKGLKEHLSFFEQLYLEFSPQSELKFVTVLPALEQRLQHFIQSGKSRGNCHESIFNALARTSSMLRVTTNRERTDYDFFMDTIYLQEEIRKIIEYLKSPF